MRLFVDSLTNIDFSFLHPARGLLGETWVVDVELTGSLDNQGMVVDFSHVKKRIKQWLDSTIDHCLLVPQNTAHLTEHKEQNGQTQLTWLFQNHSLTCHSPEQAITIIDTDVITTESVARWCEEKLKEEFPESVSHISLRFTPEHIEGPYYHYSHGLKKHDGNCQRIAHGHRSSIQIWRDGQLDKNTMTRWAQTWSDIYIATVDDQVESDNEDTLAFQYTAAQGEFYISLPKHVCYLVDTDSTVEFLAQHIADTLAEETPNTLFTVKAYEGMNKGAIAESKKTKK